MKKSSLLALLMASGLALTACSGEDVDEATDQAEDAAEETQDAAEDAASEAEGALGDDEEETGSGGMSDPACVTFFEEGGPLADRADDARAAIDSGEVTDDATYSEVSLLQQRIESAAEEGSEEVASLLEEVNAPFTETVKAVNDTARDEESGEISLPDIDVEGSEQAQQELRSTCEG